MNATRLFLLILIFVTISKQSFCQNNTDVPLDTVRIDVQAAEQRFVSQNLSILAAKYDVDIAKSNVLQAKLWYNPNITYGQTLYNYSTHKFFDISNNDNGTGNGEYNIQLQQLISYAGRYTNLVKLNTIDAKRAEFIFEEVVRALKFQMYTDFSTVYGDQQKIIIYHNQITALDTLIHSTQKQLSLGVSSKNDLVRLRAELQDDKNQMLSAESELQDNETDLKTLLHYPLNTYLKVQAGPVNSNFQMPALSEVINSANQNRGDLKLAHVSVDYEVQNLKLQRSLAVPDLTIQGIYDRAGGAGYNYTGIGLSSDIPVFNRNQGEVMAAKYQISKAQLDDSLQVYTVQNQVQGAYFKLLKYKTQYDATDKNYTTDLNEMFNSAVKNYKNKLISLLDFLDQMRAYSSAEAGLIDMNTSYYNSIQNLNYQVGTTIIK